jgi:hypothetical protein
MRIACNTLVRLKHQGRYALLINRGLLNRGKGRQLSPIGGGLQADPSGMRYLISELGATDFEKPPNLRFRLQDEHIPDIVAWFLQRIMRETTAQREIREELGDETGILTAAELSGVRETFAGFTRLEATTQRSVVERRTVYLSEIFNVRLPAAIMAKLVTASQADEPWLYFATPGEIKRNRMDDGTTITSITRAILMPSRTLR